VEAAEDLRQLAYVLQICGGRVDVAFVSMIEEITGWGPNHRVAST